MTSMLSPRDLEQMRNQQEENFPDVVRVVRRVLVSDGFGGQVRSGDPDTIHAALNVKIIPGQMEESFGERGRPLDINRYTVRAAVGTNIEDEDMLIGDEYTLQVERVHEPRSNDTVLTMTAERIS